MDNVSAVISRMLYRVTTQALAEMHIQQPEMQQEILANPCGNAYIIRMMDTATFVDASAWVLPVIFAITLHEAAHGWMAERYGDPTARLMGRVSFNPLKHIDPVGTIGLPAMLLLLHSPVLFGYAKPVPVDFNRLTPPRKGMMATAIAGPGINILLALACGFTLGMVTPASEADITWFDRNMFNAILINCALATFNLVPILPLDGGRVLRALLPGALGTAYAATERYGMMIVLTLLLLPSVAGIHIFADILASAASVVISTILYLTGNEHYPGL